MSKSVKIASIHMYIYTCPDCIPRTLRFKFPRTSRRHLQYLHRHSGNGPTCFGYPGSCSASSWEFGSFPTRTHSPVTFTPSSWASKLHRYVGHTAPRASPMVPDKSSVRVETMMSQTISAPSLVILNRPACISALRGNKHKPTRHYALDKTRTTTPVLPCSCSDV